ncbi:MAG: DUF523 domain-containing protein [Candidatus Aenigmatarchaeota archaeon]
MRLCSACLLGIRCLYNGKSKPNEKVLTLAKNEVLIPVCPEQLGGQATPRLGAEIREGDGYDVLDKKARVIESNGNDVTDFFVNGANEVLKIAQTFDIKEAILKQRSPSCASGHIYDGTFSKTMIDGDGVTTALLKRNGIKVISEEEL